MNSESDPPTWKQVRATWRRLPWWWKVAIAVSGGVWFAMAARQAFDTAWWLSNDGMAFRLRWMLARDAVFYLFLGLSCAFVTRARRSDR